LLSFQSCRVKNVVAIFELEEEADLLRDCDRRADERFRVLDMMEEQDGKTSAATLSC
jgi:hypothetical protein